MTDIHIREAKREDARLILSFIRELAEYEKALDQVTATVKDIENSLFATRSTASALICTIEQKPAGYAVYFENYSTWLGQAGIYLEDLYVTPQFRTHGAGKALLQHLAAIAVNKGYHRFEWSVLDWNKPAIDFYESLGAVPLKEWIRYRLSGHALAAFAGSKS